MDFSTLEEFLKWLMGPGGAVVGYWLMENLEVLASLGPEVKRYVSLLLPGCIAGVGWLLLAAVGYAPMPETALARFEALFAVFVAAVGAQLLHGRLVVSKKGKCCEC